MVTFRMYLNSNLLAWVICFECGLLFSWEFFFIILVIHWFCRWDYYLSLWLLYLYCQGRDFIISAQFRFFVVVFTGFLLLRPWCNPTHSPGAAVRITNPLKKGWAGSTFESVLIRFQRGFESVLVRFARNFVTSCNPIWDNLCGSLLLFDFLESRFPARIIKKLFQCAAKPAGSETIDDRIDSAGYEYAGVY